MMGMRQVVLVVVISLLVVNVFAQEQKRLISFSETYQRWMTEDEVLELVVARVNFIDVTDYVNMTYAAVPTPSALPNQPEQKALVTSLLPSLSSNRLTGFINGLSNFTTRYYKSNTGAQAAVWIQNQFKSIAAASSRTDITVELFPHSFVQSSVIATIPGRGPHAKEVVIIGGHEDSIVSPVTGRSPGVDDDASGTATVLEVFRVLVGSNYVSDRTVKFMTYAGEEAGLLGSQAIATSFSSQSINVYAVLQLDMTGYGNGPIGLITDYTNAPLTNFLKLLVDAYSELEWTTTKCGYGCSDHASWNNIGYRACIPFETTFSQSNPYIHTANDVLSKISVPRMLEVSKIALSFVVELAGRTIS